MGRWADSRRIRWRVGLETALVVGVVASRRIRGSGPGTRLWDQLSSKSATRPEPCAKMESEGASRSQGALGHDSTGMISLPSTGSRRIRALRSFLAEMCAWEWMPFCAKSEKRPGGPAESKHSSERKDFVSDSIQYIPRIRIMNSCRASLQA
jgi:hypothetical protein